MRGAFYVFAALAAAAVLIGLIYLGVWSTRRVLAARRVRMDRKARRNATWVPWIGHSGTTAVADGERVTAMEIGVALVAETSAGREELDSVVLATTDTTAPDYEVQILMDRAKTHADGLNQRARAVNP